MKRPLNTNQVRTLLRERYPAAGGAWAFLEEVRNGTGYQRTTRSADALAMSLWPSRGLEIHGFEIKVSRSDWKKELEEPAKAEEISRFCDRWWVVVGSEEIVQPGELPPTWGLLIPRGKGLMAKVEAPKLEAQPITRLFLASLLRNARGAEEGAREKEIAKAVEVRLGERLEHLRVTAEHDLKRSADREEALRKSIADFEAASGVQIDRWNAGQIGEAVRAVLATGNRHQTAAWLSTADQLVQASEQMRRAAEEFARLTQTEVCPEEERP